MIAIAYAALALLSINLIFGIPNYEQLFDGLHLYWVSSTLRYIGSVFLSEDEQKRQIAWIHKLNELARQKHMLDQRDLFLKELVIEYAAKDKLNEIATLANEGPDDWQEKLRDQEIRMWIHQNHRYAHFAKMPDGYIVRDSNKKFYRVNKDVEKNPMRYVLKSWLITACKARDGCCLRKCQCCLKSRGLDREERLIYTHCTIYCGCCIRRRGFIYRDLKYGAGIPGFVDHSKETASIENASGKYRVK